MRRWVVEHAMPRLRERGVSSVMVPIYGPDGEVLSEVHVADDAPSESGAMWYRGASVPTVPRVPTRAVVPREYRLRHRMIP